MVGVKLDEFRVCGLLANVCELRKKHTLEIANYLKVSKQTIHKIVQRYQISASPWRFDRETVNDWLKTQSTSHFSQGKGENE